MKQLTYVNDSSLLFSHLSEYYDITTNVEELLDNVFIDWYPLQPEVVDEKAISQLNILESAIKNKCKVAVFDRYLSLKPHEVEWLLRYDNVTLFEPCLLTRKGFSYLPFWYKNKTITDVDKDWRAFGIVRDPYRNNVSHDELAEVESYADVRFTVLFGTRTEYNCGYLPDMTDILDNLCVPLLPIQHKYYSSLFWGLTIKSTKNDEIDFYLNMVKLNDVMVYGIYKTMEDLFPEMLVENVANKIKSAL